MFEVSGRPLPQENVAQALTLNALTSFSSSPSPISRPNTTIPSVDNTRMSASLLSNTSTLPLVGVAGNAGGVFNVSSGVLPTLSSTPTQPQVANTFSWVSQRLSIRCTRYGHPHHDHDSDQYQRGGGDFNHDRYCHPDPH
ncbi:hypothetical protein HMI56_002263 [Coelomomyces lativittatus]|nr:hypothetical protein HMI56_002263 [Coelomomyces lativittatus]